MERCIAICTNIWKLRTLASHPRALGNKAKRTTCAAKYTYFFRRLTKFRITWRPSASTTHLRPRYCWSNTWSPDKNINHSLVAGSPCLWGCKTVDSSRRLNAVFAAPQYISPPLFTETYVVPDEELPICSKVPWSIPEY